MGPRDEQEHQEENGDSQNALLPAQFARKQEQDDGGNAQNGKVVGLSAREIRHDSAVTQGK